MKTPTDAQFYAYIMHCADDTLYCGYTTDLEKRIQAHNGLIPGGAKYTRGRRPVTLAYCESFHTKQEAQARERAIKKLKRSDKEKLISDYKNTIQNKG